MLGNILAFALTAYVIYITVKGVVDIVKKIKNRGSSDEEKDEETQEN